LLLSRTTQRPETSTWTLSKPQISNVVMSPPCHYRKLDVWQHGTYNVLLPVFCAHYVSLAWWHCQCDNRIQSFNKRCHVLILVPSAVNIPILIRILFQGDCIV
jgi:hypothetical protein